MSSICLLAGCIGEDTENAKMVLNVDTINFCNRTLGETVVWNDVQITNTGRSDLLLSKIAVRGDDTCAFQVFYPEQTPAGKLKTRLAPQEQNSKGFSPVTVPPDQGILLKVVYTPSEIDKADHADLVIQSNASNLVENTEKTVTTVISMCGFGAAAESSTTAAAGDAGAEEDGGLPMDGGVPCESCGKILKKGAPGCEAGYEPTVE